MLEAGGMWFNFQSIADKINKNQNGIYTVL